jgi:membrane protein
MYSHARGTPSGLRVTGATRVGPGSWPGGVIDAVRTRTYRENVVSWTGRRRGRKNAERLEKAGRPPPEGLTDREEPAAARAPEPEIEAEEDRGRLAEEPPEIPPLGWRDIAVRLKDEVGRQSLLVVAAGVAFFAFLSIFPGMAALVSIYGIVSDPGEVGRQIQGWGAVLPPEAQVLLADQLRAVARQPETTLGFGVVIGIVVALSSAMKGIKALMMALNIAYRERERRGFFKQNAVGLMLTLATVLLGALAIGLIVVVPILLNFLGFGRFSRVAISVVRWPLLAGMAMTGLALLYRYGPSRQTARWQWASWGAVVATALWLAGSALFSLFVQRFGQLAAAYGSVGAIVVVLVWLLLSAYVVLLGAELNAEMELQTSRDTTTGKPRPRGHRGAYVADTVAARP